MSFFRIWGEINRRSKEEGGTASMMQCDQIAHFWLKHIPRSQRHPHTGILLHMRMNGSKYVYISHNSWLDGLNTQKYSFLIEHMYFCKLGPNPILQNFCTFESKCMFRGLNMDTIFKSNPAIAKNSSNC